MLYTLVIFKIRKFISVVLCIMSVMQNFTLPSSSVRVCEENTRGIRIRVKGYISCLYSGHRSMPVSLALTV